MIGPGKNESRKCLSEGTEKRGVKTKSRIFQGNPAMFRIDDNLKDSFADDKL